MRFKFKNVKGKTAAESAAPAKISITECCFKNTVEMQIKTVTMTNKARIFVVLKCFVFQSAKSIPNEKIT